MKLSENTPIETAPQDPLDGSADAAKPGKNRRFVIVGIVVLVLLAMVAVPSYLTSRPGFWGRFSSLSSKYTPWSKSTHAKVSCEQCHIPPGVIARGGYRARMVGEFYLSLLFRSRTPKFGSPTNDACLACHNDLRSVSPKGDLKIPHRAHVTVLKMQCIQCHNYLVHELSPAGKHDPPMAGCLRCHNGDTAKNGCTACHTAKATPETHKAADWDIVHPTAAAEPNAPCNKCHAWTKNWCADCHARRPQSHTDNWRTAHGAQVSKHRSCEACHQEAFCIRCHGEFPNLNLNPNLKLVE
ncbi:MAG: hypothetical protein WCI74_07025 [Actinomycetes bacterium]